MQMTPHTYQTVLPEMHAAKTSASLDFVTKYRATKKKASKADIPDARGPHVGPHQAVSGPRSVTGLDQKLIKGKEKPQVTASESWGFSEPPSGFEPETYALRVPARS